MDLFLQDDIMLNQITNRIPGIGIKQHRHKFMFSYSPAMCPDLIA